MRVYLTVCTGVLMPVNAYRCCTFVCFWLLTTSTVTCGREINELRKTMADERMLWQSKLMRAAAGEFDTLARLPVLGVTPCDCWQLIMMRNAPLPSLDRSPVQVTPSNSPLRTSTNSLAVELGIQSPPATPKTSPTVTVVISPRNRPKAGMFTMGPNGSPTTSPQLSVKRSPRLSVQTSPTVSVVTSPPSPPARSPRLSSEAHSPRARNSPRSPRSPTSLSPGQREAEWIRRVRKAEQTLKDNTKVMNEKAEAMEQELEDVHAQLKATRAAEAMLKVKCAAAEKSLAKANARERALMQSEEKMARVKSAHAKRKREIALKEARVDAALAEANKVNASASDARRNALEKESEYDKKMADLRQTQVIVKKKMKALDKRLRGVRIKEEAAAAALQTAQAIESSLTDRQVSVKRTDAATRALTAAKEKQAQATKALAKAKEKEAQAAAKLKALHEKERELKKMGALKKKGAGQQVGGVRSCESTHADA